MVCVCVFRYCPLYDLGCGRNFWHNLSLFSGEKQTAVPSVPVDDLPPLEARGAVAKRVGKLRERRRRTPASSLQRRTKARLSGGQPSLARAAGRAARPAGGGEPEGVVAVAARFRHSVCRAGRVDRRHAASAVRGGGGGTVVGTCRVKKTRCRFLLEMNVVIGECFFKIVS